MRKLKVIAIAVCGGLLVGCVSPGKKAAQWWESQTWRVYDGESRPLAEIALLTVRGPALSVPGGGVDGYFIVVSIDSQKRNSFQVAELIPGEHTVEMKLVRFHQESQPKQLKVNVQAGHRYEPVGEWEYDIPPGGGIVTYMPGVEVQIPIKMSIRIRDVTNATAGAIDKGKWGPRVYPELLPQN